ncbi:hypothetical protein F6V30_04560 [Oryzomonas sagensis]|uniref:Nitrogenase-associated protein n=1 Tax=Oryzomonas sagensis TaxID=2603857 RepID=A0ABQ6TSV0_9BACT|nr:ArsC/Spx/MgsR family protein [Oryzomonas sagensis]KAB0671859.1 hypothetical protein F6V30_04560 [Oryzomonas sagensis]
MARVIFYEKPGCINNGKQKALLRAAGHDLAERSILTHPWTAEELVAFFGALPVREWFNRAAPRVKNGEVVPERMEPDSAIAAMLEEPLLIRRPLMQSGERRMVGFDQDAVHAWIGLWPEEAPRHREDLQHCPRTGTGENCTEPSI